MGQPPPTNFEVKIDADATAGRGWVYARRQHKAILIMAPTLTAVGRGHAFNLAYSWYENEQRFAA